MFYVLLAAGLFLVEALSTQGDKNVNNGPTYSSSRFSVEDSDSQRVSTCYSRWSPAVVIPVCSNANISLVSDKFQVVPAGLNQDGVQRIHLTTGY